MTSIPIAVAMPVHDGAKWLPATLDSLADQAGDGLRLVVRDSTPDDSCRQIVDRYRDRLNIDYARWPEVKSWTRKTNEAVKAAQADHVCILHQDDLWLPERLAVARECVARHPGAALICSPSVLIDAHGRRVGVWRAPLQVGEVARTTMLERLIVQNFIAMPSPVMRRDAYLAVGGLDESLWYTPDWDLYLKLAQHGTVVYDPRATTAFRLHGGSLTLTGDRDEFADQLALVLDRHASAVSPRAARIGRASVRINTLLADAALGNLRSLALAVGCLLGLGIGDAARYLKWSRIVERTLPRLRLRIARRL